MASRLRRISKKERASSLSPSHSQDQYGIKALEEKLKEKDEMISELKKKLQAQETVLDYRLQCMERLKAERDELRNKNSTLVGKNAELSRKQSVGSFGSPTRRISRNSSGSRPSLPPTPDSPEPIPSDNQSAKGSPEIQLNGRPTVSFNNQVNEDSETDYSDMEDDEPISSTRESQFVNSGEVTEKDILQELEAVMKTASGVRNGGSPLRSGLQHGSYPTTDTKLEKPSFKSKPPVSSTPPTNSSAIPIPSSNKSTPEVVSTQPRQNGSPVESTSGPSSLPRNSSGSGAIAQQIKNFLNKRGSEDNIETPPNNTTEKVSVNSGFRGNSFGSGQLPQRVQSPLTKTAQSSTTVSESQDSITSGATTVSSQLAESDVLSSYECTTTDVDSSFDFSSPPLSPARILPAITKNYKDPGAHARNKNGKLSKTKMVVNFAEESKDIFDTSPVYSMRSRTHTLAAINNPRGQRHMERGRKKLKELKKEKKSGSNLRRQSSLTNINDAQKLFIEDLELISPEIEAWFRGKIIRDLEKKFGGADKANKAAMTIQRAYREYKLNRRFKEIRKGKHRNRAQSMRVVDRRPSILQKQRPIKYRREFSTSATYNPQLKAREASQLLSRERNSHSHTGTRLDLVHKKRRESHEKVSEMVVEVSFETPLECALTTDSQDITFKVDGACQSESSTDPTPSIPPDNKTDGLPPSLSADDVQYQQRLSIFSTGSSVASSVSFQEELQETAVGEEDDYVPSTLPRTSPRQFRSRTFSVDTTSQKKNIGVNHFNRKPTRGIQYLVMSDILEDDPRCVAEFLLGQYGLSKAKIGEFVGEINSDFSMAVLECLVEQMDMSSKTIDQALRQFQLMFRMPGEAQKIDKIMEVFAVEYYKGNKDVGSIRSEDAAYMLSFAIMMLHTSLHNPSVRSRISKQQWVTMNRGCNEGENFPKAMLMDVYDRIQSHEFTTGTDHTDEVIKIEKQILGSTIPKLANPQRRILHKLSVSEVSDLNSKPVFVRARHRRTLFVFSDIVIICKHKRNEFLFKDSFTLLNLTAVSFESHYYKHGLQLHSSIEDRVVLQCNCDSAQDRDDVLLILEKATAELTLMETERIAELGTSLATKPNQDIHISGGSVKHRLNSGAGDLLSSTSLSFEDSSSSEQRDYVSGVGDLAVNTSSYQGLLREVPPANARENRSSGDSGFDSQQPTPTLSPSPTEGTRFQTPSPTPSPSHSTYLTPNPSLTAPPRSKSSDTLRTLTVIPSSPQRSPSAELFRRRGSSGSTFDKKEKKKRSKHSSEKKSRGGLFSFSRNKTSSVSAPKRPGSTSPPTHRDLQQSFGSNSLTVQVRARSSSTTDLTKTT